VESIPLQALERTHGDVALLHEYRQSRCLSPERGICYSSTGKRPWKFREGDKKTENECSFIGMSAIKENKLPPIPGEIG